MTTATAAIHDNVRSAETGRHLVGVADHRVEAGRLWEEEEDHRDVVVLHLEIDLHFVTGLRSVVGERQEEGMSDGVVGNCCYGS